ncbi:hypothetical protein [Alicyclobacillus sp. SO9]|uniref:protein kinase domain-containing protein n=1 Tax=Alicyclobacillus sp. SO9 TaxID=2665646 RepID=UPI0018E85F0D|nr:hypothetical protein [Alicyclobacillus sp. SO9]QQE79424.1 hypothetical protein GI364_02665 [Alicyclobacillus sp. SO9]
MNHVQQGTVFTGKWTRQSFKIAKCLGEGANGAVYLAYSQHGYGALKFCQQASDAALEWNILEQVSQVQTSFPRPILIDDWETASGTTYFYVMEWVSGKPLDKSVQQLDASFYYQAVEQIALGLSALHGAGMAFCDIKPQNILVALGSVASGAARNTLSVRFVDVGGVTAFGRSVRQFTPISDRAFWDLGSRRAEPGYDLCGLSLSLLLSEKGVSPGLYQMSPEERQKHLKKVIRNYPYPELGRVLERTLDGKITDTQTFLSEWRSAGTARPSVKRKTSGQRQFRGGPRTQRQFAGQQGSQHSASVYAAQTAASPRQTGHHSDWTEWVMWISLVAAALTTGAAWATFLGWRP